MPDLSPAIRHLRDLGRIRKDMVFTYPSPSRLGIQIDANTTTSTSAYLFATILAPGNVLSQL